MIRPELVELSRTGRLVKLVRTRRSRRTYLALALTAVVMLAAVVVGVRVVDQWGIPRPVGEPDPGHRLLNAIRPVAAAVPSGSSVTYRSFGEPGWESCDGVRSTYGWGPATVDVSFVPAGRTEAEVVGEINATVSAQGWVYDTSSPAGGAWYWYRSIEGRDAYIQLMPGSGPEFPDWDLQANVAPLAHPSTAC